MCVLGFPEVVYPIVLFGIDICSEGLCNRLDGVFCTAVCLLVKGSQWHEVNIESFVEFCEEIGYKLWSLIRDDFMRYSMEAVEHTYECIYDVCVVYFFFIGTSLMRDENRSTITYTCSKPLEGGKERRTFIQIDHHGLLGTGII